MLFNQIEFLPIAYFVVLMWVVCASVAAKALAPMLIELSSDSWKRILSLRINIHLTSDDIHFHLFEKNLLADTNTRLLISMDPRIARAIGSFQQAITTVESRTVREHFFPEKYWSGCPPKFA